MTTVSPPTSLSDVSHKLFGFSITYATGACDWGLIVATDKETARLRLEGTAFAGIEVTITVDQPEYMDIIQNQYNGLAFLTTEPTCN